MKAIMNTKKLFWVVLCAAMAFSVAQKASAKEVKIAFVDLRRALNETNEGKRAMKKLQKEKDKLQKKIDKKEESIMKMQDKLKEQQSILSQEALQKKAQEYYQAIQELQQSYAQFQQELAQKEMKATQDILVKMETIVAEMGKKDGYTMIYDRSVGAVVWAPAHLDLTDQLIQLYNEKYK
ncbi:MAG: OmpH family outer membrane protein [Deltaproteobacteria bacterium]|nr:OmpH family outer membrane protein [Deltaproteobacteria bacterium]MBN2670552.1 OmpH family outer membrane protein [Deltaproteobacteria bacterium]